MAKLLNLSINVSKIDKTRLIRGEKGKYLNLTIAVNDKKDQFDNDVAAWEGQTKEEREGKNNRNFLGNGRVFWSDDNYNQSRDPKAGLQGQTTTNQNNEKAYEDDSEIPF